MIPADALIQLATIGLSKEQVEAVAAMLRSVEDATRAESCGAIEARRANDRARKAKQRHGKSRDVTGQDVTSQEVTDQKGSDGSNESITLTSLPPKTPTSLRSVGARAVRVKARSQIAANEPPDETQRRDATEHGLSASDFRDQWGKFRDHHRAKGSLMADWHAAWRTWLRGIGQFQPRAGPAIPPQNNRNVYVGLEAQKRMAEEYYDRLDREREQSLIDKSKADPSTDARVFPLFLARPQSG
jgi:hypothetical protein